jgi:Cytochrome c554 and c-prime
MRMLIALCASIGIAVAAGAQMLHSIDATGYWPQSLEPQGAAPAHWSAVERSLAPEACGECHADQLAQWQTSRHAHALSPGVLGQLITFEPSESAECMQCHAPLAEQRVAFEVAQSEGVADHYDRLGLAAAGNSCGGCHLRSNHHFGPPQRGTGAVGQSATPSVHDGVTRTQFFETSEFCARCHQFANDPGVNGKPLENTFVEWQSSPQAAQGQACQSCHMPNRRHLWRGIHDPDMVRSGLTMHYSFDAERVRFAITNTGVGHAFPTYAVPKVVMHAVALDRAGVPQHSTELTHVIARMVSYVNNDWTEISDTRLMPGQTAAIELPWNGHDRIRVWLEVIPDHYYTTQVFPPLLQNSPDRPATNLIAKAAAIAEASPYTLFGTELRRP